MIKVKVAQKKAGGKAGGKEEGGGCGLHNNYIIVSNLVESLGFLPKNI